MSGSDNSAHLTRIVEKAIKEHGLNMFAEYWELYKDTAHISSVQRFFVTIDSQQRLSGGYCNVAVMGDGLLVDIEGDDSRSSGSLTVESLASVTRVSIHAESLPGLQISQGASLVLIADSIGQSDIGFHWVAKTEDEEEHLIQFAKSLVSDISNR